MSDKSAPKSRDPLDLPKPLDAAARSQLVEDLVKLNHELTVRMQMAKTYQLICGAAAILMTAAFFSKNCGTVTPHAEPTSATTPEGAR